MSWRSCAKHSEKWKQKIIIKISIKLTSVPTRASCIKKKISNEQRMVETIRVAAAVTVVKTVRN